MATDSDGSVSVLSGIKVLDLSRVLAGPWCTQILADFGADVIKIEAPATGDDTRAWGPPFLAGQDDADAGESAYFLSCNRNKRSAAINLAHPQGSALIRDLAKVADIVIENFKLDGLKKYGLDYESLSTINPRLIYCSVTGFGQTGPYADRGGYDFVVQGAGGLMSITGESDGPPLRVGVAMTDISTGMYATVSILMALRHAEKTGQGQWIDISLLDTQISMLANQAMSWLVDGTVPKRLGNRHPTVVPYKTFDASDGTIIIAAGNDGQFRQLCKVLGQPAWAQDARYARSADRTRNRDQLEADIQNIVGGLKGADVIAQLLAAGVPSGPVNTVQQVFEDPFVEARQTVHHYLREDGVRVPTVAFPAKLSKTPAGYFRRPPYLGEHSRQILKDWLCVSDDILAAYERDGVIASRPA